jgi:hypothetical protein
MAEKISIAELGRYAGDAKSIAQLAALLRLALAAHNYVREYRIGDRQGDFMPPLREALSAFDFGDEVKP